MRNHLHIPECIVFVLLAFAVDVEHDVVVAAKSECLVSVSRV